MTAVDVRLFVKKPVHVNAMQFTGGEDNAKTILEWAKNNSVVGSYCSAFLDGGNGEVYDPEHIHLDNADYAYADDWIVKEEFGFTVLSPRVFEATYEEVTE